MSGNMEKVLRLMVQRQASDVYLSTGAPVQFKIHGTTVPMSDQPLTAAQVRALISEVVAPEHLAELDASGELNVGVQVREGGLFRLSAFRQSGSIAAVLRCIPSDIPTLAELGLPATLESLILERRGLVLMVGATGTGKSTTLAAMLEHRNRNLSGHILTIEDPVEFQFTHKKSVVNQREVGRDTASLHVALRNALRQAPDVILIGEIRDRETMSAALSYALSGHLVVATLHANNSYHALGRILSLYPADARTALLSDLAAGLKAVVAQRLLRSTTGGRVPAVEVMMNTKFVGELIERGDFNGVRDAMEKSMTPGSQTFEQDLARMVLAGQVSRDEALQQADSASNLMWRLQHDSAGAAGAPPVPAGSSTKDRPDTNPSHPGPASAAPSTSGARPPQFPELSG
ncbi:MAG: PilT/PilU family type 4a pilus ATPase [Rubrivivax sp.]|jgi:twitching motility protein PilU|nr:PilT/PilU family type 4a pilus ATPase [Rubrivivax sp.]